MQEHKFQWEETVPFADHEKPHYRFQKAQRKGQQRVVAQHSFSDRPIHIVNEYGRKIDTLTPTPNQQQNQSAPATTNEEEIPSSAQETTDRTSDEKSNKLISTCQHKISWCLVSIFWFFFVLSWIRYIQYDYYPFYFITIFIFILVLHSVECYCTSTPKYLKNTHYKRAVYKDIARLQQCIPEICWDIECYHYTTSGSGENQTQSKQVTHRANMKYSFQSVQDISAKFDGLEKSELIKLAKYKKFSFVNKQTEQDYNRRVASFKARNVRDMNQDFSVAMNLKDFEPNICW